MTMKKCGVYKITNTVTGDYYIGSSMNVVKRMQDHHCLLSNNAHYNPHLQNSWNKHGKNAFAFETILLCDPENQLYYEQVCIDALKPAYNIATNASASAQGLARSDETRKKMSEANSGENHPNFGKHHSEETKRKISEANIGKHHSEETRRKMSEALSGGNNPMYGKTFSEEHKQKMSEAKNGHTTSEETRAKISESLKLHFAKKKVNYE